MRIAQTANRPRRSSAQDVRKAARIMSYYSRRFETLSICLPLALSEPDFARPVSHTRPVLGSSVTVDRAADTNETFHVPRANASYSASSLVRRPGLQNPDLIRQCGAGKGDRFIRFRLLSMIALRHAPTSTIWSWSDVPSVFIGGHRWLIICLINSPGFSRGNGTTSRRSPGQGRGSMKQVHHHQLFLFFTSKQNSNS